MPYTHAAFQLRLDKSLLVPRPTGCRELLDTIADFRGIITFRSHFCISAYSMGVLAVGISWNDKVDDFMRTIGFPERALSGDRANTKEIVDQMERVVAQPYDEASRGATARPSKTPCWIHTGWGSRMNDWLRKLQLLEVEQLRVFADICERHGLRYYLVGGTLLGAVRHKGFIPWDDDIDVAMPRADYNRFLDLAPSELPPQFELEIPSRIPKDPYYLTRIRRRNTVYESAYIRQFELPCTGVWIDVFPLDDEPCQDSLLQRLDGYLIERHLNRIIRNYYNTGPVSAGGGAYLWLARRMPFEFYRRARDKIARRHEGKNLPFWLTYAGVFGYRKETFAKSVFEPPQRLTFEGRLYNVPRDHHLWLTRMYGNYMRLPPPEKQVPHKAVRFTIDGVSQL